MSKKKLADLDSRIRALTDLGSTLIVEAAAGTGKTSLLAGRIVKLLLGGVEAKKIAAITFTEFAAGELKSRIYRFLNRLEQGDIPTELLHAFPKGLSEGDKRAIASAAQTVDELTCTTIHGFCQRLITPYPVEAGIDPGAAMMDEGDSNLAFESQFQEWLRDRLRTAAAGPLAELILETPKEAVGLIGSMAKFALNHRNAKPPALADPARSIAALSGETSAFRKWYRDVSKETGAAEEKTESCVDELERLAGQFEKGWKPDMTFGALWRLAHPQTGGAFLKGKYRLRKLQSKGNWEKAFLESGDITKKAAGEKARAISEKGQEYCLRIESALVSVLDLLSQTLQARFVAEFEGLKKKYAEHKRLSALLDFDDLLYRARDLLREKPGVRKALSDRFSHVLVDEFQDTDPIQCEILFLLCGAGDAKKPWDQMKLRDGQLFVVGDPKQAIYRFRRADIRTYIRARDAIVKQNPAGRIDIVVNFRSTKAIVDFANEKFREPLSADGQPGFAEMVHWDDSPARGSPGAASIEVQYDVEDPDAVDIRRAEALAVAETCEKLIGNFELRAGDGRTAPCRPGDIALLAPAGTELWIYEREFEERGIAIATQAGKSLFRRQEIQDILAGARILADARDTLAFGALMRGPLVGLTEEDLLDIVAGLPPRASNGAGRFWLRTDPAQVRHPVAADALRTLQELEAASHSMTPFDALSAAVERLNVRPLLAARYGGFAERALANVDIFLEMARPYAVRGMRAFARAMMERWEEGERQEEGRIDSETDAVQIITFHSAKGLEWPVVIPINAMSESRKGAGIILDRKDDTVHVRIGRDELKKTELPTFEALKTNEEEESARERKRQWYVACTRAKDLLLLPKHPAANDGSWLAEVDLGIDSLPDLKIAHARKAAKNGQPAAENIQTQQVFEEERRRIIASTPKIVWKSPSRHEKGEAPETQAQPESENVVQEIAPAIRGGAGRGSVLHKLMEEVLTGEIAVDAKSVKARADELIRQAGLKPAADPSKGPCPAEMAETVGRTLSLPIVAGRKTRIAPEFTVFGTATENETETAIGGRADAVAFDASGNIEIVIDWKSDVEITAQDRANYRAQMKDYLAALGVARGAIVYMTKGEVDEVMVKS